MIWLVLPDLSTATMRRSGLPFADLFSLQEISWAIRLESFSLHAYQMHRLTIFPNKASLCTYLLAFFQCVCTLLLCKMKQTFLKMDGEQSHIHTLHLVKHFMQLKPVSNKPVYSNCVLSVYNARKAPHFSLITVLQKGHTMTHTVL